MTIESTHAPSYTKPARTSRLVLERPTPHETLAQQQLRILVRPVLRRQGLQEHDHGLQRRGVSDKDLGREEATHLEIHSSQRFAPLDEERQADVEMELGERVTALSLS
jgi:hypothetical protein